MESITGTIGRTIYHQTSNFSPSGNKFLIALFDYSKDDKQVQGTIKGEMNSPVYGWQYKLYGEWTQTDRGPAFFFASFEPVLPKSNEGMADYLARSVPEVGKVRARLIVDHFGEESFSILKTNPERIREVKGVPLTAREAVESYFLSDNTLDVDPAAYARLYDLLSPVRPPRRVITTLLNLFKSNAPQFITENPYKLLDFPGMGWIRVDKFAVEVLKYDKNGIERHKKAIIEVLSRNSEHGHTKIDHATVHCDASNLLGCPLLSKALTSMQDAGEIIIDDQKYISTIDLYNAEMTIAREIKRICSCFIDDDDIPFCNISIDGFDEEQTQVPEMVMMHPFSILSGVPGSGKSHSVSLIVKGLYNQGINDILIVAPTGKAAKRNAELIQQSLPGISIPCMTIHRALGGFLSSESEEGIPESESRINRGRERFTFEYGKDNKLPFSFFIMDESSMCDSSLMASFLKAIPDGSRLLIVGDHYQLPSVGPGSVLRDLMASGIPSVVLDKPRRNSGSIAYSCYMIKEGKNPNPQSIASENGGKSNWIHIEEKSDEKILSLICETHKNYIKIHGHDAARTNLQVASPQKKKLLGCYSLNNVLGPIVNPDPEQQKQIIKKESDDIEAQVRVNDKIVREKNGVVDLLLESDSDYDINEDVKTIIFNDKEYIVSQCQVVNGDSGQVIGFKGSKVIVRFFNPDRLCLLSKSESHIALAYAMTVHKMQGSGFPIVIMPLSDYYWNPKLNVGLYCRELIYTSFSRPIERLITIGRISELYKAISRVTIHQRQTRLKEMIENESYQQIKL